MRYCNHCGKELQPNAAFCTNCGTPADMEPVFKTETIHDLALHKEFNRGFIRAATMRNVLSVLLCLGMLWMTFLFDEPFMIYYFLILSVVFFVILLIQNRKGGDINYRRMLQLNNGQPQHLIINICADGIHCSNRTSSGKLDLRYDLFRYIIDTPNLLIMVMEHRQGLVLEKRHLQGGTVEELTAFLLNHCPNIKRKRVKTTTFGTWMLRINLVVFVITLIFAIVGLTGVPLWDRLTGKLHNGMTYQEMAQELAPLGITISDQTISELEEYDRGYENDYGTEYYNGEPSTRKIQDLLYWEGAGVYDEETDQWTPSTSGIYWFDMEVWNVDSMYTDFFTGLCAMNEELDFSNVQEDYSKLDPDNGTGTVTVRFDYHNQRHALEASYLNDWFDVSFLYDVGKLLRQDSNAKDLYYADDGQGILLYYGEKNQVKQLERITGISFRAADGSFPWF